MVIPFSGWEAKRRRAEPGVQSHHPFSGSVGGSWGQNTASYCSHFLGKSGHPQGLPPHPDLHENCKAAFLLKSFNALSGKTTLKGLVKAKWMGAIISLSLPQTPAGWVLSLGSVPGV